MEIITAPEDVREYSPARGMWIAEAYAEGEYSLRELSRLHPDRVPAPFWVYRWRREFPAFDLLMLDAEKVRAAVLADDLLTVADDDDKAAAHNANRMKARQWLAERMDRSRFAAASRVDHNHRHSGTVELHEMSDDQLAAVVQGERPAIEGEVERGDGVFSDEAPPPPRSQGEAPGLYIPSDPSTDTITSHKPPVAGNDDEEGNE